MYTFSGSSRTPVGATTGYSTSDPVTGSITVNPRDTLLVTLILNSGAVARAGGAPTFGGYTMLQADTSRGGLTSPEIRAEMWYITASGISLPSISGSEISVPNTNADRICFDMVTARAGDGKTSVLQVSTGSANATTSTNPYCNITTTAGSTMIFEIVANGANSWAPTARTGTFTNINDNDIGVYGGGMMYSITNTVGVITGSWTFGTAEDWGIVMAAFGERNALIYVQDCIHALTSDSVVLTYNPPQFSLTVETAAQAQTSENTILTYHEPNFTLTTQDAEKLQAADNVTLTQNYLLTVQDAEQAQTAENVVLSAYYVLTFVDDGVQLQTAESIILTARGPPIEIIVQDAEQAQTADNINLLQGGAIGAQDAQQAQTSDNVALTQHQILVVQDAIQLQSADNVILTAYGPSFSLTVQNAQQLQISSSFFLMPVRQNGARVFNGTSDRIDWDNIANLQGSPVTVSAWVFFNTITTNQYIFHIGVGDDSAGFQFVSLSESYSQGNFLIARHGTTNIVRGGNRVINAGTWVNLLGTHDGTYDLSKMHLYVDGIEISYSIGNNGSGEEATTGHWSVGGRILDDTRCFNGKIAEVAVWNRVLDTNEIATISSRSNLKSATYIPNGLLFCEYPDEAKDLITNALGTLDGTTLDYGPNLDFPDYALTIQNAQQVQTSDNVVLKQNYSLTVQDAQQIQTSENVALTQHYSLTVNDAIQLQTSENVVLTQNYAITIQDATQLQTAENVALTQHYVLTVNYAVQIQTSDNISIGGGGLPVFFMHYRRLRS